MASSAKDSITISPKMVEQRGGIGVLSLREYQKLLARTVPAQYLRGKSAAKLDRLVEGGLRDYRKGKTRVVSSLADLDA